MASVPCTAWSDHGLHAALQTAGPRRNALLKWHPRADALQAGAAGSAALNDLLWQELEGLEATLPSVVTRRLADQAGLDFWLRRRRWTRWETLGRVSSGLPLHWMTLGVLSDGERAEFYASMGVRMVGHASFLENPRHVIAWLTPLGKSLARQVADQLLELRREPLPRGLVEAWHAAFKQVCRVHGRATCDQMGRALLGGALGTLPEDVSRALHVPELQGLPGSLVAAVGPVRYVRHITSFVQRMCDSLWGAPPPPTRGSRE